MIATTYPNLPSAIFGRMWHLALRQGKVKSCPSCQRRYPDEMDFCPADATRLVAAVGATEVQLSASLARRFRIVRRLGAGGMGSVFLAEQLGVGNRPVALKVLSRRLLDDPEFLTRFQNEAGSTGRIGHPNVVTVHESGQADDGTPYIVMEYLPGESLREALQRRGALPLAECADILQQTAQGLNAAHKLGIIHRDLKPDNIFLTPGEDGGRTVKIVDFGIAKLRESTSSTATGVVLGTPAYMSSEQASGMRSDQLDARSDVYALGIVAYEMLSGRVPFHSDTPLGYLRKHMLDDPPPLRAVLPAVSVPAEVEAAVMKTLAKNRDQRFGSALEFARAFTQGVSGAVETEQPPIPLAVVEPSTLPQPRSSPRPFTPARNHSSSVDQPSAIPSGADPERAERERQEREGANARTAMEMSQTEGMMRETEVSRGGNSAQESAAQESSPPPLPPVPASRREGQLTVPHEGQTASRDRGTGGETHERRPATSDATRLPKTPAPARRSSPYLWASVAAVVLALGFWYALRKVVEARVNQHLTQANGFLSSRQYANAEQEFRAALDSDPNSARAHYGLGVALQYENDPTGAQAEERQALRLNPNYAEAHQVLGFILAGKGDWDEAIEQETIALKLDPNFEKAHVTLGLALMGKGDFNGVIEEERAAISLAADDDIAHGSLAYALEQKGDREEALREYRTAASLDPANTDYQQSSQRLARQLHR